MLSSLILGLIFCTVNAQNMNFVEERPMETFPVTAGAPRFVIDLDYPQAFEVTIKSYNGNESSTGFCDTFPSQIAGKIEWVGPINMTRDEVDDSGLNEKHSYDNIEFYNGYYFILDSLTFQITAIKDFNDQASYITIESEYQNQDDDEQLEDTYLILNPDQKFLYIITRKNLLSYSLTAFMDAVKNNKPIPKIKNEFPDFKPFDMILSIRYHKRRLYIVADTNVQVYVISKEGQIAEEIKLNSTFFETPEISISDIAFKGNYAYVLDKLRGVYVVDISKADTANATLETKFQFQPDGTREVQKGQFIEIVGDSLHVISSETKTPFVFEYIIRGDPVFLSLEFNRKIEIFQSVRDTFTDSNYLYLLTGFFNMATKHSIPGRYHSPKVEDYLVEYWPVLGAKALVSRVIGTTSKVAVLHGDVVTVINFEEKNPYISCNTAGVEEGFYVYELNAVQKDCDQERNSTTADYNSVCEIKQKVQLFMIKDTEIVTPVATKQTVTLLYVGIGVMGVLVIVFVCLFRKYRSQYKVLEDKIKFHKLDEDNTDQNLAGKIASGRKDNVDSQNDINPYSINIQAELKKEEEKERQKALSKSPQKSPQKPSETEKPNAEFGDIKPLDIEEIYGRKGKASQDDSD